jgi:glycosyltransferase involved in cell wall biosynthesis
MRSDVLELLCAFDVFALSSRFEGLPIAMLEAMAAHVPPVATRVGGIPEVVTDGRDGLLVEPGDPESLAAAAARLLDDSLLRQELGDAAAARSAEFDLAGAVARTQSIYDAALGLP